MVLATTSVKLLQKTHTRTTYVLLTDTMVAIVVIQFKLVFNGDIFAE